MSFLEMPNQPVSKSFFRGKAIPITQMHPKTLKAHGRDVRFKAANRQQLKGAKITYYKRPDGAKRNGRPILDRVEVEGPNMTHAGSRGILGRKATNRGFNHDAAYYRGTSSPKTRYLPEPRFGFKNPKTGVRWGPDGKIRTEKVEKTFIPGKGYVSATKLPKSQLRMTVRTQRAAKARVRDDEARHFQTYRAADKAHKDLLADIGQKGKELPSPMKGTAFLQPNWAKEAQMKSVNIEAFAIKRGGRKNGQAVMVVPKGATKDTVNHEMAHLTPKRSGYRLHQVLNDPKKLMREEGRAEMATRSRGAYYKTDGPSTSGYIDMARDDNVRALANFQDKSNRGDVFGQGKYTKETLEEFKGVQDKIFEARRARGRDTFVIGGDKKFRGNQYVDDKKRRKVRAGLVALGGGTAAGGGGYSAYRWNKKRSAK